MKSFQSLHRKSHITLGALAFALVCQFAPAPSRAEPAPEATQEAAPAERRGKPDLDAVLLHQYDKNHNGTLEPDEREAARRKFAKNREKREAYRARQLAHYDANENGKLDPEERRKIRSDREAAKARQVERFDRNGDGKLGQNERNAMRATLKQERQERRQQRAAEKAARTGAPGGDDARSAGAP